MAKKQLRLLSSVCGRYSAKTQGTPSVVLLLVFCTVLIPHGTRASIPQTTSGQSTKTDRLPDGLEILTPHEGVDFTAFSTDLLRALKRNWWSVMPSAAKNGTKGRVTVRFGIRKDGQLSNIPMVEVGSGRKDFDAAAVSAVHASAPFGRLPESFKSPSIELRITFLYNLPPSAPNP